ncbi:MAG: FixH family protein [Pseudomonadales bacterium]
MDCASALPYNAPIVLMSFTKQVLLLAFVTFLSGPLSAQSNNEAVQAGSELLLKADSLEQQARALIQQGSQGRKDIKQRRQRVLQLPKGEQRTVEEQRLQQAIAESLAAQRDGAELRKQASELRDKALDKFAEGLRQQWPQWAAKRQSIQLSDGFSDVPQLGGHNVRTRSVHPSKKDLAGSPETEQSSDMSLALPRLSAQQLPPQLNTDSFTFSRDRRFIGHIEVLKDSVRSEDSRIEINELHQWVLVLSDLNGAPVEGATIAFTGHMPGHVHGLPTQPEITEELAPGIYRISGVKFQMRGWWVIELKVAADQALVDQQDSLRFNLHL